MIIPFIDRFVIWRRKKSVVNDCYLLGMSQIIMER